MRSIVIGAGYAGLAAATRLAAAGRSVTVLEARARVGGRAWSEALENGVVVERGAEYIFPGEHAVRALAAEYGIPIVSHGVTYERRTLEGRRLSWSELLAAEQRVRDAAAVVAAERPDASVQDAFVSAFGADHRRHPYFRRFATSVAADPAEVGVQALLGEGHGELIDDGGRLHGGNQSLAVAMAASLGEAVRLSTPVAGIRLSASDVTAVTAAGESIVGDELVIAVPLPLVRELDIGFPLPPAIDRALARRGMGDATKCSVALREDVGDPAVQSAEEFSWSWQSLDVSGAVRVPALTGFTGGGSAARYAGPGGAGRWLDDVTALRGPLRTSGEVLVTAWRDDPWTQGAYSHPLPGWDRGDIAVFDELIGGRVTFAGEFISTAASLDGAASSGVDAAHRLLRAHGVSATS
ncbi:flavin monoamine oxidase family protein [Microbacterium paraoxydans]|uniref:flavin monoamine oxidase family protein n=1 Tax=Microbacterium paraoxydans TaxID=199592 RepID=UPI00046A71FB|nr:NAD(P)/FAD-dependent oxidoreductase [Microbacterium paraoxydans]